MHPTAKTYRDKLSQHQYYGMDKCLHPTQKNTSVIYYPYPNPIWAMLVKEVRGDFTTLDNAHIYRRTTLYLLTIEQCTRT